MKRSYDAVVIGAGHNGLVAASYLARGGLSVLVLERRRIVGGCAVTEAAVAGLEFDTGAHRVGGLPRDLIDDLGLAKYDLQLMPTDPSVFTPSVDGGGLVLWRDVSATADAIRPHSSADADAWPAFTDLIWKAARVVEQAWKTPPPDPVGGGRRDLWNLFKLGVGLRRLGRRDMPEVMRILPMSIAELVGDWFESALLRGTLAASAVSGLFQGPMGAGTVYGLLHHHVSADRGAVRPTVRVRGGIGRLSEALAASARALGVEVRTEAAVERILIEDGRAAGVVLSSGEEVRSRRVLSNADPRRTFFDLVGPSELDPEFVRAIRNVRFNGVCAKVHLALRELPRFAGMPDDGAHLRGVISISPSLEYVERAYDDAKYGKTSVSPVLEVSIPTVAEPDLAPGGEHLASVLVQYAPHGLRDGVWDQEGRNALADLVIATLSEYAPNVQSAVLHSHVMTPVDLEDRFGLTEGNLYHGEHTMDQLLFMRPVPGFAQYRSPIPGLFMCGAGSHPGGGVIGVPGRNAAKRVLSDPA